MKTKVRKITGNCVLVIPNKSNRQKRALAKKAKEANVRREVAKRWDVLSKGTQYVKAATKRYCRQATLKMKDELFSSVLLSLNERNSKKSHNIQQRLLRRIVEKRQAQMAYRRTGHTEDLFANHISKMCFSKSINYFKAYQGGVYKRCIQVNKR